MEFNDYAGLINQSVAQNNAWSAEQAQKQMDFQERLSNSAHQREVADLKAAGLNPILSAHTNGASTPSGAMATGDSSGTSALVDMLGTVIKTENANARAALKAAQNQSQASHYKDPMLDMLWQTLLTFTGNGGKSAEQIAQDAYNGAQNMWKNLKSFANDLISGKKNSNPNAIDPYYGTTNSEVKKAFSSNSLLGYNSGHSQYTNWSNDVKKYVGKSKRVSSPHSWQRFEK